MDKPIKVLQVRSSVLIGGVETSLLGWLNNIDKNEFDCPVALFKNPNDADRPFRERLEKNGHAIIDIPWKSHLNILDSIKRLAALIRELNIDLLHTHDWRSDVVGYYAAKQTNIPIMTTVYVWFKHPLKTYIFELIDSWYIRRFDMVTAVCDATRLQAVSRGVKPELTRVLISGINPDIYPQSVDTRVIRDRYGISEDDICYVFVARFYPEKGHLMLLDALKEALGRNIHLKLLLLGSGPLEEDIRQHTENLGIGRSVIMPGFVPEVLPVLKSMDVMVHASLAEGISMAIYEGMLMGLPVIGSDVDGTPEVVKSGQTGWLVPVSDRAALSDAILEAAENPDLRQLYGDQARRLIVEQYNMEKARDDLQSAYRKLAHRGNSSP